MTEIATSRTVFETIYSEDQWTNGSGPGSHPDNTTSVTDLGGGPTTKIRVLDSISDLPGGDLCICKDVSQHLPNATIVEYLGVIVSRHKFAILTKMCEPEELVNTDIAVGGGRPLRFGRAPFNMRCAIVLWYFPRRRAQFWKNGVFLIVGDR